MKELTFLQKLLSRIAHYTYPVNELADKRPPKVKRQPTLFHQSAEFFWKTDDAGVKHLMKKGITYKRKTQKPLSKRAKHRQQVKEK